MKEEHQKLLHDFANKVISAAMEDTEVTFDSTDVTDIALELGLLIEVPYDPQVHQPMDYLKAGEPYFDLPQWFKDAFR